MTDSAIASVYPALPPLPTVHPWQSEQFAFSLSNRNAALAIGNAASAAWPAASLAIYVPIRLFTNDEFGGFWVYNGANASDSIDMGLYVFDGNTGIKVQSLGLQSRSGTSALQQYTSLMLPGSGSFYMAICLNGTTGSVFRLAAGIEYLRAEGVCQEDLSGAGTPGTLPATMTPATLTVDYLPVFGLYRAGFTI